MESNKESNMKRKNRTPDILHKISAESIHPKYYFQALIEQSASCGLLTDRDISAMQLELMTLLAEQTDQWSHGESSSIPTEKAQEMMASVMFVLGVQLKTYPTPEQAVELLKTKPLKSLFECGLKLVRSKMAISRRLQKQIADNLLNTPNVYYRSTIVDGINGFFKLYRPQFTAHEIHITADYPVLAGRPEVNGIEFIEQYLRCIEAENAFCRCFDAEDIHDLLCGLTPDYPQIPMNLFEPVLLSALGLILVNRNPVLLDLHQKDIDLLQQQFSGQPVHEIQDSLEKALLVLDWKIKLPQTAIEYAFFCMPGIAVIVQNAVKMKTLDKVFLIPAYSKQESPVTISWGN